MEEARGRNGDSNSTEIARAAFRSQLLFLKSLSICSVCMQFFHLTAWRNCDFLFFFWCFLSCAHPNKSEQMEAELLFNLWHSLTCTQILFSLWWWIIDPFSTDLHCLSAEHAVQTWSGPHLFSETHFRYSKSSVPTHTLALTVALSVHKNNSALFVGCAPSSLFMKNPIWGCQVGLENCFDYV